jgi:aryl-alcohol dehydrogenase-like predicted oxidoreductase
LRNGSPSRRRGAPVKFRRVGDSDLLVSEIGFGCGGNAGLMVRGSAREQAAVIAKAAELGINYFDNAPDYGAGEAEKNLGRTLKELQLRPIITTKIEIRSDDLGDIAAHIVRSAEASLTRLGIEWIDILQIHNGPALTPPPLEKNDYRTLWLEDFLRPKGALEGLRKLVSQGKARYLGFVCRGDDAESVRELLDTSLFKLINVSYHLLNPTAGIPKPPILSVPNFGRVLDQARARGVGTAIYSPLAGGTLTDESVKGLNRHPLARPAGDDPTAERERAQAAKFGFLADGNRSLAQAAVSFILAHPGVTTILAGISDRKQLEEIAATPDMAPITPALMERVQTLWDTNFS